MSRFQYEYRKTASKRHIIVGEILRTHPYFCNYQSYQEYAVELIDPTYPSGREMIDWAIPQLKLAIEVQGEHHTKPVRFGGISEEEATERLAGQQRRDRSKENALSNMSWTLLQIPYWVKDITADYIIEEWKKNFNPEKVIQKDKSPNEKEEAYNKKKKEKAKEIRQAQYQKQKEWKKKNGV